MTSESTNHVCSIGDPSPNEADLTIDGLKQAQEALLKANSGNEKLVASAATLTSQAEKVLGDTPTVLQDAFNVWRKKQTDPSIAPLTPQTVGGKERCERCVPVLVQSTASHRTRKSH